jgi:hypothetical protein
MTTSTRKRTADPAKVERHVTINWLDENVARVLYGGEPTDYVVGRRGSHFVLGLRSVSRGEGPVEWRATHFANADEITRRLARYWAGTEVAP